MDDKALDFKIYDAGSLVGDEVRQAVIQITVDDAIGQASVATIKLLDENSKLSDGTKFKVGNEVKIDLGYVGTTKQVFMGEVTGWQGAFPRRGNQTLTVIAKDKFHRLRRNRRQKTFSEMKDSDAVSEAAQEAGLSMGTVDPTPITQNCIIQWNETDADFILERANLFGWETFVDDKGKLVFRKPDLAGSKVATLEWHKELRTFSTSLALHDQQKELKVTAWDMVAKTKLEASALEGDERNTMGGTVFGAGAVADVDASDPTHYTTNPGKTADEVDAYAKGLFQRRAERFVRGAGTCIGDPNVVKGKVIELTGLGNYLSGPYYVQRAVHVLAPGRAYVTEFDVLRTAVQAPAPPPTAEQPEPAQREAQEAAAEGDPLTFEVQNPGGAPLSGVPFVLVDPSGERQSGDLSSDGKVEVQFEDGG